MMPKLQRWTVGALGVIVLFTLSAFCGSDSSSVHTQFFGMGSYEFGQIMKGQYADAVSNQYNGMEKGRLHHYWLQKALMEIGVKVSNDDGWGVILAGEGMLYFPYALPSDGSTSGYDNYLERYQWYFDFAEGSYSIGDPKAPALRIGAGFFKFKYNPDGRNFGDYLFRLNCYPQYMPTSFDTPYQRLLGLHVSSTLHPFSSPDFLAVQQDLLLTSETAFWPLRDFSLTYIVNFNLLKFADIGAGVKGERIFPVEDSITHPTISTNAYDFTFMGAKVMLKLALDFKRFLPYKELWGQNDWRLYSEACFNGLKNYPIQAANDPYNLYPGYNDIKTRLPVLIGFDVPTCKILDVLSIEGEWWDNKFANTYSGVFQVGYNLPPNPVPYVNFSAYSHREPYGGPWHWSIYAKKSISEYIRIMAQAARDHTVIATSLTGTTNGDLEEAMDGKANWAWMCKIEFGF